MLREEGNEPISHSPRNSTLSPWRELGPSSHPTPTHTVSRPRPVPTKFGSPSARPRQGLGGLSGRQGAGVCGEDGKEGSGDEEEGEGGEGTMAGRGVGPPPHRPRNGPFLLRVILQSGKPRLGEAGGAHSEPYPGPGPVYRANELPATTSPARLTAAQAAQSQEGQGPRKLLLSPTLHLGCGHCAHLL